MDLAEDVVVQSMKNIRLDLPNASKNARWVLERLGKGRGYGKESTVNVQGGDTPLKIEHAVSIETLDLPLDVRKKILEAVEQQDAGATEGTTE